MKTGAAAGYNCAMTSSNSSAYYWISGIFLLFCVLALLYSAWAQPWVGVWTFGRSMFVVACLFVLALRQAPRVRFTREFAFVLIATVLVPVAIYLSRMGWNNPLAWIVMISPGGRYPLSLVAATCLPFCTYAFWTFRYLSREEQAQAELLRAVSRDDA